MRISPYRLGADAVELLIGRNRLRNDIEKHVDDVAKGRGRLSARTALEIERLHGESSRFLSSTNPTALGNYRSLLTGVTYDKRARIVAAVNDTVETVRRIPSKEEAEALKEELLKRFGGSKEPLPESA